MYNTTLLSSNADMLYQTVSHVYIKYEYIRLISSSSNCLPQPHAYIDKRKIHIFFILYPDFLVSSELRAFKKRKIKKNNSKIYFSLNSNWNGKAEMGEKGKKEIRIANERVKDEDTTILKLPRHARVSRQDQTNRIRERCEREQDNNDETVHPCTYICIFLRRGACCRGQGLAVPMSIHSRRLGVN